MTHLEVLRAALQEGEDSGDAGVLCAQSIK